MLKDLYNSKNNAKVAQLVERNLAKVEVAGSNLVFRSFEFHPPTVDGIFFSVSESNGERSRITRVAELVDAQDLKSCFPQRKYGFNSRPGYHLFRF